MSQYGLVAARSILSFRSTFWCCLSLLQSTSLSHASSLLIESLTTPFQRSLASYSQLYHPHLVLYASTYPHQNILILSQLNRFQLSPQFLLPSCKSLCPSLSLSLAQFLNTHQIYGCVFSVDSQMVDTWQNYPYFFDFLWMSVWCLMVRGGRFVVGWVLVSVGNSSQLIVKEYYKLQEYNKYRKMMIGHPKKISFLCRWNYLRQEQSLFLFFLRNQSNLMRCTQSQPQYPLWISSQFFILFIIFIHQPLLALFIQPISMISFIRLFSCYSSCFSSIIFSFLRFYSMGLSVWETLTIFSRIVLAFSLQWRDLQLKVGRLVFLERMCLLQLLMGCVQGEFLQSQLIYEGLPFLFFQAILGRVFSQLLLPSKLLLNFVLFIVLKQMLQILSYFSSLLDTIFSLSFNCVFSFTISQESLLPSSSLPLNLLYFQEGAIQEECFPKEVDLSFFERMFSSLQALSQVHLLWPQFILEPSQVGSQVYYLLLLILDSI